MVPSQWSSWLGPASINLLKGQPKSMYSVAVPMRLSICYRTNSTVIINAHCSFDMADLTISVGKGRRVSTGKELFQVSPDHVNLRTTYK
jgi:hypothetical protein